MIRKSGRGYVVVSHTGKRLSRRGLSHAAAVKRLRQVEYFKHQASGRTRKTRRKRS